MVFEEFYVADIGYMEMPGIAVTDSDKYLIAQDLDEEALIMGLARHNMIISKKQQKVVEISIGADSLKQEFMIHKDVSIAFSSERKFMVSVFQNSETLEYEAFLKGAFEMVSKRVLSFGYANFGSKKPTIEDLQSSGVYEFVGLSAISDLLQDGVNEIVESCFCADIDFWMLTGDNIITALNISKKIGMVCESGTTCLIDTDNADEIYNSMKIELTKTDSLVIEAK
ncbi:MAG: hypothetical protein MHPSP_002707, partial [Paramarteilia canceri]